MTGTRGGEGPPLRTTEPRPGGSSVTHLCSAVGLGWLRPSGSEANLGLQREVERDEKHDKDVIRRSECRWNTYRFLLEKDTGTKTGLWGTPGLFSGCFSTRCLQGTILGNKPRSIYRNY